MNTRIYEALTGRQNNYILPFFWQHGEDEDTLRNYMEIIQGMGIHAVCVESRPHPDFAGPKWWKDMDVILDEARRRNMKVWILDDCHFPTGYANGAMKHVPDRLQKWTVCHFMVDLTGPSEVRVDVGALLSDLGIGFPLSPESPLAKEKKLLCALLCRRAGEDSEALTPGYTVVTGQIRNGLLPLSLPAGPHRLFLIYKSANAGLANNHYVNFLQEESSRIMLEAVYEPHYQRYREHFGTTIAGFFSDEPGFYNCIDSLFNFDAIIGRTLMPLPWSDELEACLKQAGFSYPDLIRLWYDTAPEQDAACRYCYMDTLTRLYEKNFSLLLGNWCRDHGVEYIGHILEDNNSSSRLGPSVGHYFRAMTGQDMSGIDVVTSQILPGRKYLHTTNAALNTRSDGEFYHYALSKLGSGDAHTDLRKKGRAMCEIFGNYGWAEGIQTMKWLADFMLVRGINLFVPHAFSPKAFPDPDCPPHFYAHGNNMQHGYMKYLFTYMNRVAHILNGGSSRCRIGILYHAEAEWSGEAMLFQKPGRICMERQADYDVVSIDRLMQPDVMPDEGAGVLSLGSLRLHVLIIPRSERLPFAFLEKLCSLSSRGFPILFLDSLPAASSEGTDASFLLSSLARSAVLLPLCGLGDYIASHQLAALTFPSGRSHGDLRVFHYSGKGYECVMVMNESISETIRESAALPHMLSPSQPDIRLLEYDAFENCLYETECRNGTFFLLLEPGESRIFLTVPRGANLPAAACRPHPSSRKELTGDIRLSISRVPHYDRFRFIGKRRKLTNLSLEEGFSDFHGVIRYEMDFISGEEEEITGKEMIWLDGANEVVTLRINDSREQVRIGTPYRFSVGAHLRRGVNHLILDNITTVFPYKKDHSSINAPLHPMGICGHIWLEKQD